MSMKSVIFRNQIIDLIIMVLLIHTNIENIFLVILGCNASVSINFNDDTFYPCLKEQNTISKSTIKEISEVKLHKIIVTQPTIYIAEKSYQFPIGVGLHNNKRHQDQASKETNIEEGNFAIKYRKIKQKKPNFLIGGQINTKNLDQKMGKIYLDALNFSKSKSNEDILLSRRMGTFIKKQSQFLDKNISTDSHRIQNEAISIEKKNISKEKIYDAFAPQKLTSDRISTDIGNEGDEFAPKERINNKYKHGETVNIRRDDKGRIKSYLQQNYIFHVENKHFFSIEIKKIKSALKHTSIDFSEVNVFLDDIQVTEDENYLESSTDIYLETLWGIIEKINIPFNIKCEIIANVLNKKKQREGNFEYDFLHKLNSQSKQKMQKLPTGIKSKNQIQTCEVKSLTQYDCDATLCVSSFSSFELEDDYNLVEQSFDIIPMNENDAALENTKE